MSSKRLRDNKYVKSAEQKEPVNKERNVLSNAKLDIWKLPSLLYLLKYWTLMWNSLINALNLKEVYDRTTCSKICCTNRTHSRVYRWLHSHKPEQQYQRRDIFCMVMREVYVITKNDTTKHNKWEIARQIFKISVKCSIEDTAVIVTSFSTIQFFGDRKPFSFWDSSLGRICNLKVSHWHWS